MARLRGLPSEHHHEGPGDAPRRKRGRATKKSTSSEPVALSKRSASPTAEASQTKRARLIEEQGEDDVDESIEVETLSTTKIVSRSNRRHSEPPVTTSDKQEENSSDLLASTQPASGLTPHLDRIGAARTRFTNKRRARMSMPAQLQMERVDEIEENGNQIQYAPLTAVLDSRTRRRLRRSHLSQEVIDVESHQKRNKKELLDLRRQLRAQDDKIQELEFQLEAQRMGDIDITDEQAHELEQELAQARSEMDDLRASSAYNGEDNLTNLSEDDVDELVLVKPDELSFSQDLEIVHTPDGKYASRVRELESQVTFESLPGISQLSHDTLIENDVVVPDGLQDQAKERYERELQHYIALLAESQGALRIVTIELQNLHFIDPGASCKDIISEMRHGFETLRVEIEKYFPSTTAGLTNKQLLSKIPQLFSGVFFELREKITLIESSKQTELLLRRQFEGVLDHLGDSEERVQELQQELHTIDKSTEEKERTILDQDERLAAFKNVVEKQISEIEDKDDQIKKLREEAEENATTLERLRNAVEVYSKDLDTVTKATTALEQEHADTIARMEQEQTEAIQQLQSQLDAEADGRDVAEAEVERQREYIEELEGRIARMDSDVDSITTEMQTLRDRLTLQTETLENAESERDAANDLVYSQANVIENLNEQILLLKEQLVEAKSNLAAEQSQREQTEADLDKANEEIEELNNRVHNMGIQANELRSRLFEVQQEKEAAIAALQEEAQEREDDLTSQLTTEVDVRGAAESTITQLDQQITVLQNTIVELESGLDDMAAARDQLEQTRDSQVTNLASQLADLKAKYAALETSTNSTITSLQANITDLNNQVQRQQAEIKHLVEEVADKDRLYTEETTVLQEKIALLETDLADQKAENDSYRKENASLSVRVADEANELLTIMASHDETVIALKTVISTHEATIANLQASSAQRAADLEADIQDRDQQIAELQRTGTERDEMVLILETQITTLKERFAAAEQDTSKVIDQLITSQRALQEQNEELADQLKARNKEALMEIQELKVTTTTKKLVKGKAAVDLHNVANGRVVKTSEKVRVGGRKKNTRRREWDSGYGLDERVEADEEEVNGEAVLA